MKYLQLLKAIDSASQHLLGRAAAAVNQALVMRNWLIGAYIVEFEQNGEDRAKYGARLLARLGADLKKRQVRGSSPDMLERMRQLYFTYPQLHAAISAPVVRKLAVHLPTKETPKKSAPVVRNCRILSSAHIPSSLMTELNVQTTASLAEDFAISDCGISRAVVGQSCSITPLSPEAVLHFSWTHLVELIRIDDPLKRAFYENECLKANWSKRQLQRQIGSLLFERTGLSTNKAAVIQRARRQEPQQTIEDLIRDPYVLEFTGLGERPEYTESDQLRRSGMFIETRPQDQPSSVGAA